MIVFEVKRNGQLVCTAGVGNSGLLITEVMWDKRNPALRPKGKSKKLWAEEMLDLHTTGYQRLNESVGEHLRWGHTPVSIGDEIVIRVLDRPDCDPPLERKLRDPNQSTCGVPAKKKKASSPARKKKASR